VSYFAAALAHIGDNWSAHEVDLDEVETIDDVVDLLRELEPDASTTVLFVEEDDEYVAIVRLDVSEDTARVFVSDGRAADTFAVAEMLAEEIEPVRVDEDEEEPSGHDAEPLGDAGLLADLGTSASDLLELCAHEGILPSDVISTVCENAGCSNELENLREV